MHYLIPADAAKSGLGWVRLWKDGSCGRNCEKTLEVPQAKCKKTSSTVNAITKWNYKPNKGESVANGKV
jgi:hypothetical protein